jgi:hypothetical protein
MAKSSAKDAIILINGNLFSTYTTAFNAVDEVEPVDATGFGDGSRNFVPGIKIAQINADMLWDSATGKVHDAMKTAGQTGIVSIIPEAYALGGIAISLPYLQGNYNPVGDISDILKIGSIEFKSYGDNYGIEYGNTLYHGTITNTATGTSYDNAAATSTRYSAILHIWTATADDTYVVKVQHSTDNNTWADLATFTLDGQTVTAERLTGTSVNRYRRIVATRTGAAADSFGFTVVLSTE